MIPPDSRWIRLDPSFFDRRFLRKMVELHKDVTTLRKLVAAEEDNPDQVSDDSSPGAPDWCLPCDSRDEVSPPPDRDSEELQEPRVDEIATGDITQSTGKYIQSPTTLMPESPQSNLLVHERYNLSKDEAPLNDSFQSMGYFPCYQTCTKLTQYQPLDHEVPYTDEDEEQLRSAQDAQTQCSGSFQEEGGKWEDTGKESNTNFKEAHEVFANLDCLTGQSRGGSRPVSSRRNSEGSTDHRFLPHVDSNSEEKKDEDTSGKEKSLKPCRPGNSTSQPNVKIGVPKEVPGLGSHSSPLPTSTDGRKCPRKKHHKSSQTDNKDQEKAKELKQIRSDQRSLPPRPEEKPEPLLANWNGAAAAGENIAVQAVAKRKQGSHPLTPSANSCTSVGSTSSPAEPSPSPSRHRIRSLLSWARNIFRNSAPTQDQPSARTGIESRWSLRVWIAKHQGHVRPYPC